MLDKSRKQRYYNKMRKKRQLTPKQAAYIKALKKTKNQKKALLMAGYSESTAKAHNVVKSRRISDAMADVLESVGVTKTAIAKSIKDGLTAKLDTDADHKIRLASAKLGAQLRGDYTEKVKIEGIANVGREDLDKLIKGMEE